MTGQPARPRVYLDHNATAPLRPEARAAAGAAMDLACNPSSVHAEGRRARALVEEARSRVASLVGAAPAGVVFTSGATEHAAVLHGHRFQRDAVTVLPVLPDGLLDRDVLRDALAAGGPALVAVQAANHGTGVVQPVCEIAATVRSAGGMLVCDAVQAAGRIDCRDLGADVLLLSGHKLGGLAGAGAAVAATPDVVWGAAMLRGGGQERGRRAGTENVAAIAAFGAAAAASAPDPAVGALRDRFEAALLALAPDAEIFGRGAPRLPNTSAFAVPGVAAERLLMALDLDGVAVSSGSACASGKVAGSHVLDAMKVKTDFTSGAIRVSFGWDSVAADVDRIVHVLGTALHRMRRGRLRAAA